MPADHSRPCATDSGPDYEGVGGRVMLAGDWHGNEHWARISCEAALRNDCRRILQLGDFGLWPGREDAWLDHVDQCARKAGAHLVWLDGNHENHDVLEEWRSLANESGLVQMRESVTWATRGARWEWGGLRFGALGGAVSLDRFLRRKGHNWWPGEEITRSDVERLGDGPLDVLATHTPPTATTPPRLRPLPFPQAILDDDRRARSLVDQAIRRTTPKLVVHGHLHVRYTSERDGWRVEGLAHDKSSERESLAVLELDSTLLAGLPG